MEQIRLGKTNRMVSRLGFGGIPIQRVSDEEAVAVVKRCLELGINYIDTANGYTTSEARIGRAIQGRREELFIASKSRARNYEGIKAHLQLTLERMGIDYIDLYQLHDISESKVLAQVIAPGGTLDALEDARKAGKVRHIGVTCHQIDVAAECIKTGRFETVMFPLNMITDEAVDRLLPLARERDMGFIAMKPLAGGMIENITLAFRFLAQFPDVLPIPGIETTAQIEQIAGIYNRPGPLSESEKKEIDRLKAELGTQFCRRCDYCQPCTAGITISAVMTSNTMFKRLPPERIFYGIFSEDLEKADSCTRCGKCEERCPFHLPIMDTIEERFRVYQEAKREFLKNSGKTP